MNRYLTALICCLSLLTSQSTFAATLRGSFEGNVADGYDDLGQVVFGDFSMELAKGLGGFDSINVTSQHFFLDGQELISPKPALGGGWVENDSMQIGDSYKSDSVSIYLGWAFPSSHWNRWSLGFESDEPQQGPLNLIGYGVGFEFVGPTSWFDAGASLESIFANMSVVSESITWLEILRVRGDIIFAGAGFPVPFTLSQFQVVPEPKSMWLVYSLATFALTHQSRSLRWRFLRA